MGAWEKVAPPTQRSPKDIEAGPSWDSLRTLGPKVGYFYFTIKTLFVLKKKILGSTFGSNKYKDYNFWDMLNLTNLTQLELVIFYENIF